MISNNWEYFLRAPESVHGVKRDNILTRVLTRSTVNQRAYRGEICVKRRLLMSQEKQIRDIKNKDNDGTILNTTTVSLRLNHTCYIYVNKYYCVCVINDG